MNSDGKRASNLIEAANHAVLIVLVLAIAACYILNETAPDGLIELAKWVTGAVGVSDVAYFIKSGMEQKAEIEAETEGVHKSDAHESGHNRVLYIDDDFYADPGEFDI